MGLLSDVAGITSSWLSQYEKAIFPVGFRSNLLIATVKRKHTVFSYYDNMFPAVALAAKS